MSGDHASGERAGRESLVTSGVQRAGSKASGTVSAQNRSRTRIRKEAYLLVDVKDAGRVFDTEKGGQVKEGDRGHAA